ncbi:MAG: hypothetical protein CSA65_05835 [Proteobacteria bacterium]|nr:MAG: hypothetical protein CSA65_05835 [Pseudomonadota bacterium]
MIQSMRRKRATNWISLVFIVLACSLVRADAAHAKVSRTTEQARKKYPMTLQPYTPKNYPDHGTKDTLTPQGRRARGFYLTPYWLHRVGAKRTAKLMKAAHLNAVVIDLKDDFGQVLWRSKVPLSKLRGVQRRLIKDPRAVVKAFHDEGIYVIGRLVAFKDSKLVYARPDLAVRFKPGKRMFWAGTGWLDAYSPEVRDYLIDLALEWQAFGIDEIQLDYIRFPKGRTATWGVWLHKAKDQRERDVLIASFLDRLDRALKLPLSVDIYGLTTLVDGDPRTLGQTIEKMARHVEAISPMMYANGMTSYFPKRMVTKRVYAIIQCGIWRARQKAPHIALRPYLQAYPSNVSFFSKDFIIKQLEATQRGGADGFLFWNSSMRNGVTYGALRQMGARKLNAYGKKTNQWRKNRPGTWCKEPGAGNVFERTRKRKLSGKKPTKPTPTKPTPTKAR